MDNIVVPMLFEAALPGGLFILASKQLSTDLRATSLSRRIPMTTMSMVSLSKNYWTVRFLLDFRHHAVVQ